MLDVQRYFKICHWPVNGKGSLVVSVRVIIICIYSVINIIDYEYHITVVRKESSPIHSELLEH